jgi:hypothetical protein
MSSPLRRTVWPSPTSISVVNWRYPGFLTSTRFAGWHLHHEMAFIRRGPALALDSDLGARRLHEDVQGAEPHGLGGPDGRLK